MIRERQLTAPCEITVIDDCVQQDGNCQTEPDSFGTGRYHSLNEREKASKNRNSCEHRKVGRAEQMEIGGHDSGGIVEPAGDLGQWRLRVTLRLNFKNVAAMPGHFEAGLRSDGLD